MFIKIYVYVLIDTTFDVMWTVMYDMTECFLNVKCVLFTQYSCNVFMQLGVIEINGEYYFIQIASLIIFYMMNSIFLAFGYLFQQLSLKCIEIWCSNLC